MKKLLSLALALAFSGTALAQQDPKPAPTDAPAPPPPPAKPADGGGDAPKPDDSSKAPQAAQKYSIAVLNFTFLEAVRENKDGVTQDYLKEFETSALTNKFVNSLVNTHKFDVVDRDRLEKILKEQQLGDAGNLDPARVVKTGKLIGADYFLSGQISIFSVFQKTYENPYAPGNYTITLVPELIVDMRIVDTRTGKIVTAEKGDVKREFKFQSTSKHFGVSSKLLDDIERDLCDKLTIKVVDRVYPIKVVAWKDGTAFLNRGEGQGIAVGQVLDVFGTGEALVDPDTGAVLGNAETKIGQIKVSSVESKFSKASPVGTLDNIPKGSICRPAKEPEQKEEPRKGPGGW